MEPSLLLSALGLVFTLNATSAAAFKEQKLEGSKICENGLIIKTLYRDQNKRLYLKSRETVLSMTEKPTKNTVRRFETDNSEVVFLQLPEKAMILDNKNMKPILTECKDV